MRLSRFRMDEGGAKARAWRPIQPARGLYVAIGDWGGLAGRFRGSDDCLSLAAVATQLRVAGRHW